MSVFKSAHIYVIAGVNGAGKSSIAGATFRELGGDYYNPDEIARALVKANPLLTQEEANSVAWHQGVRLLRRAIDKRLDFAFETTLGANTIPRLLAESAKRAIEIHVWYVGLSSPELHLARVQSRARRGGHDIAEHHIRRRYQHSRLNLIELLPFVSSLRVYDNSIEADPAEGQPPEPKLVLWMEKRKIRAPRDLTKTPDWAKPIVAAALKL